MILKKIEIDNYKNLSGVDVSFSDDINFIVGNNNIGKSNLLNLIEFVLSGKKFSQSDFSDPDKSIRVVFALSLTHKEKGIFDDYCDALNPDIINIIAEQKTPEDYIEYFHFESNGRISRSDITNNLNFIAYDSLRIPKNEIDFSKTKGAGAFLNYIIEKYISINPDESYLVGDKVNLLNNYIQSFLDKLSCFKRFDIKSLTEQTPLDLLSKVFLLQDSNNIGIDKTGYGVQFNILIQLSILEKMVKYLKNNEDITFHCILSFDEPEIHLNPFLQRTILNDIKKISEGKDDNFNSIIKDLFNIEEFSAQIIIATHSREIIDSDFRKVIRLYNNDTNIKGICGIDIEMENLDKHWLRELTHIKESMFANKVIIVEGESEQGALQGFSKSLGVNLDSISVAIIKASGANSIPSLAKIFNFFKINAIAILDKDKSNLIPALNRVNCDTYVTETKCFDSEIAKCLFKQNPEILKEILTNSSSEGLDKKLTEETIKKHQRKGLIPQTIESKEYTFSEYNDGEDILQHLYSVYFAIRKGTSFGQLISELCPKEAIPNCYKDAILKALE